jgi:hypothetical protein
MQDGARPFHLVELHQWRSSSPGGILAAAVAAAATAAAPANRFCARCGGAEWSGCRARSNKRLIKTLGSRLMCPA